MVKILLIILTIVFLIIWLIRYLNPYKRIAKNISSWYKNISTLAKRNEVKPSLEVIFELTGIFSQGFDVKRNKITIKEIRLIANESIVYPTLQG